MTDSSSTETPLEQQAQLNHRVHGSWPSSPDSLQAELTNDARQTRHEAQLHQIGLKTHDDELRRIPTSPEGTQACNIGLHDLAPVGYIDFNRRKCRQNELRRLNRTLRALHDCNRAQQFAKTEVELLQTVCRIITETCGHAMVWIGFAENDPAKTVRPMASAGLGVDYLDSLQITWNDTERGCGPTGTAIRNSLPNQCHDILTDPRLAPWRDEALKRGIASALVLPLLANGKAFGAVTIYSRQPQGFPTNEAKLLGDLADELALGIMTYRLRKAQQEGEEALLVSEARFRSAFHEAATPMAVTLSNGRFLEVNNSYCKMLGYSELEILDTSFENLTHPEDRYKTAIESHRQLVAGEILSFRAEKRYIHKHGNLIWCDLSVTTVPNTKGPAVHFIVHAQNITARKKAEEKIRVLNEQLESRVLERTVALLAAVTELEVKNRNRLRLEREILEISEREQSRLGQDLHDGLGQELAGIAMLGDVLVKQLHAQSHPSSEAAAKITSYVRSAIDSTRRLAKCLYPIELDRDGMLLALKGLAEQTSSRTGIRCELRQCGADPQLDKSAEIHIYRIVQECIGNAIKHAKPRCIIINSLAADGCYTVSVTNDGTDFEQPTESAGIGLHIMDYRAHLIGAKITIEQSAKGGCTVSCSLTV